MATYIPSISINPLKAAFEHKCLYPKNVVERKLRKLELYPRSHNLIPTRISMTWRMFHAYFQTPALNITMTVVMT